MIEIHFAKTRAALLAKAGSLLLAVPARNCTAASLEGLLGRDLGAVAAALARNVKPGTLGKTVTTLTGQGRPRTLQVAVLPDQVSRHNSETRAESLRRALTTLTIDGAAGAALLVVDDARHAGAAYNAVAKALPVYTAKSAPDPRKVLRVLVVAADGTEVPAAPVMRETVEMIREAGRLVDMPPNELDTRAFAARAKQLLRSLPGVVVREITGARLGAAGLGGIHAVGRCAVSPPRMLIAKYRPKNTKAAHVALVGKGVVYDTGGLHLKARGAMEGMKGDMGGAAAVLGAFRVLVKERVPRPLTLILCLAENAIGPGAYKPDDILTLHSGRTVEINNTDAEGRILLADGVSWAARVEKATVVLDAATLTGAQMVATGLLHAAIVSNDEALETQLVAAGRASGDLAHALPFAPEFYKGEFASPIADMRNSVANRSNAQASCAAQFVFWHIEDTGVRWGHVDMAGPAAAKDRGTGYGVALLAEAVRRLA